MQLAHDRTIVDDWQDITDTRRKIERLEIDLRNYWENIKQRGDLVVLWRGRFPRRRIMVRVTDVCFDGRHVTIERQDTGKRYQVGTHFVRADVGECEASEANKRTISRNNPAAE